MSKEKVSSLHERLMKNGGKWEGSQSVGPVSWDNLYQFCSTFGFKRKSPKKIKTAIITGENRMSSIKEYFKEEGRKEGIEQGLNSEELYREN